MDNFESDNVLVYSEATTLDRFMNNSVILDGIVQAINYNENKQQVGDQSSNNIYVTSSNQNGSDQNQQISNSRQHDIIQNNNTLRFVQVQSDRSIRINQILNDQNYSNNYITELINIIEYEIGYYEQDNYIEIFQDIQKRLQIYLLKIGKGFAFSKHKYKLVLTIFKQKIEIKVYKNLINKKKDSLDQIISGLKTLEQSMKLFQYFMKLFQYFLFVIATIFILVNLSQMSCFNDLYSYIKPYNTLPQREYQQLKTKFQDDNLNDFQVRDKKLQNTINLEQNGFYLIDDTGVYQLIELVSEEYLTLGGQNVSFELKKIGSNFWIKFLKKILKSSFQIPQFFIYQSEDLIRCEKEEYLFESLHLYNEFPFYYAYAFHHEFAAELDIGNECDKQLNRYLVFQENLKKKLELKTKKLSKDKIFCNKFIWDSLKLGNQLDNLYLKCINQNNLNQQHINNNKQIMKQSKNQQIKNLFHSTNFVYLNKEYLKPISMRPFTLQKKSLVTFVANSILASQFNQKLFIFFGQFEIKFQQKISSNNAYISIDSFLMKAIMLIYLTKEYSKLVIKKQISRLKTIFNIKYKSIIQTEIKRMMKTYLTIIT